MTTSIMYTSNSSLFSIWQKHQLSIFKRAMARIKLDIFQAGQKFAGLADKLDRLPSYKEFEKEYLEIDIEENSTIEFHSRIMYDNFVTEYADFIITANYNENTKQANIKFNELLLATK
jgi:hypothetical protein